MDDIAIKVENLSKQYYIGGSFRQHATFRESLMNQPRALAKRLLGGYAYQDESIWALRNISFEVNRGEVIGIIGRNGAGKSTLLKILTRITKPTDGYAELRGRVGSLLEVGTGFHKELTGRENIFLNGALLGMRKTEITKKFDEIVSFAEIEKFIDTPVKRYSSGMYVRLAFSVAAHLEPEILLVDEVLAVGDTVFQRKCLGKMGEVAEAGRTILLVSHNMGSINQLCPRSIWIDKGRIQEFGVTSTIIENYLKAFDESRGTAESCFEENPEKDFQLLSTRLLNENGAVCKHFSCDDPVTIELICHVRDHVPGLYGYLKLLTPDGNTIMVSDSFDTIPNPLDNLSIGKFYLRIVIPPRTLGPASYSVYVNFTSKQSSKGFNVDSPGIICFFRLDDFKTKRGNARGGYFSTLPVWKLDPINKND